MVKIAGVTNVDGSLVVVLEDGTVYRATGTDWHEQSPVPTSDRHMTKDPAGWKVLRDKRAEEMRASGRGLHVG